MIKRPLIFGIILVVALSSCKQFDSSNGAYQKPNLPSEKLSVLIGSPPSTYDNDLHANIVSVDGKKINFFRFGSQSTELVPGNHVIKFYFRGVRELPFSNEEREYRSRQLSITFKSEPGRTYCLKGIATNDHWIEGGFAGSLYSYVIDVTFLDKTVDPEKAYSLFKASKAQVLQQAKYELKENNPNGLDRLSNSIDTLIRDNAMKPLKRLVFSH